MNRFYFAIAFLVLPALACMAQGTLSYKTEELKKVATELRLESLDTLHAGYSSLPKDNRLLVIRKADNGRIDHIGIRLFPKEYRGKANNAILDFLESGLLCNTYKLTRDQLKYQDVKFMKGSWDQMLAASSSAKFSLNRIDSKAYQAIWKDGNEEKVNMLIPIKYDFIMNAPRQELERNFIRDLKSFKADKEPRACDVDVAQLRMVRDKADTLYVLPGKHYILETVTNSTYYILCDSVNYVPLIDTHYPIQTVANTLLLDCAQIPDARISITTIGSNKGNETIEVSVRQLIRYARAQGCVPFFSYEKQDDGTLYGALFLYNKEAGYDHVLSIQCNTKDIATDRWAFTSRAYLYTPTTNVKNLYSDIRTKK